MSERSTSRVKAMEWNSDFLSTSGKASVEHILEELHLREVDITLRVAEYLDSPENPGRNAGLMILRRGMRFLILLLFLTAVAMLFNPTLGLVMLFLTGAQLFATAFAYATVSGKTIINRRLSVLGILMAFALAALAFVGLFL